jgi:hypothetical protein
MARCRRFGSGSTPREMPGAERTRPVPGPCSVIPGIDDPEVDELSALLPTLARKAWLV